MSIAGGPPDNPEDGAPSPFVLPPPDDLKPPSDGFRTVVISVAVLVALIAGAIWFLGDRNSGKLLSDEEATEGPRAGGARATATAPPATEPDVDTTVAPPVQSFDLTGTAVIDLAPGIAATGAVTGELSFDGSIGVTADNDVNGRATGNATVTTGCYLLGSSEEESRFSVQINFQLSITGRANGGTLDLAFASLSASPGGFDFTKNSEVNQSCQEATAEGVANFVQAAVGTTSIPAQSGATSNIGSMIVTTIELT